MSKEIKYWRGYEDLANTDEVIKSRENEFTEQLPIDEFLNDSDVAESKTGRRDFLKYMGFGIGAATLAACETPVTKSIPYLFKPEEVTPGVANYYASTYYDGYEYASIVVKTREGRPIRIAGNTLSPVTAGEGTNARVQAAILGLYDSERLTAPTKGGQKSDWKTVDGEVASKLSAIAARGGRIAFLSSSVISPSIARAFGEFKTKFPTAELVQYDAVSFDGIRKANANVFGKAVVPTYSFDKAETIVSIGADFLAHWLSPIEHARQYSVGKKITDEKKLSRHFQFEANMSLSGMNADLRTAVKPSEYGVIAINLYNEIAKAKGAATLSGGRSLGKADANVTKAAKELVATAGKGLVVCGSNDANIQTVVNGINNLLGNYGNTISLDVADNTKQGSDTAVATLVADMNAGKIEALFVHATNPIYSHPNAKAFSDGMKKVGLRVAIAERMDETAAECEYVLATSHFLESWGDFMPRTGQYSLQQPTIAPIFKTRQALETLLVLAGAANTNPLEYIKGSFSALGYATDWNTTLRDGVYFAGKGMEATTPVPTEDVSKVLESMPKDSDTRPYGRPTPTEEPAKADGPVAAAPVAAAISSNPNALNESAAAIAKIKGGKFELAIYEKAGLGSGVNANNPWLQEMPDPVTKVTWDNYVTMAPEQMTKEFGFNVINGQEKKMNVVEVDVNGVKLKLPVYPSPGQAPGTIGIALGYGRTKAGKSANGIGANAFAAVTADKATGALDFNVYSVTINKTDETYALAATQTHHTMMGRDTIVKETTLAEFKKDPKAGNPTYLLETQQGKKRADDVNLWEDHPRMNHKWGMSIDLNACIGCGACVIGCQTENNVAVVGKDEIRRGREMHWIRIDRYYTSDMTEERAEKEGVGAIDKFLDMEIPAVSPRVVFQPVMCQHCNHAPCETVCPVLATTHSNEGLNQMTYNRCIGTKYCGNNCPYKVRRFNWFKYNNNSQFDVNFTMNDDLGKMVLNPDVTVRSRGVMEKCSMCVQRIQEGKLNAKKESRRPMDGEIKTACQQSCPTNAIIFGDLNDATHEVSKLAAQPRMYHLLEEVGVQPSVFYQTLVRNITSDDKNI